MPRPQRRNFNHPAAHEPSAETRQMMAKMQAQVIAQALTPFIMMSDILDYLSAHDELIPEITRWLILNKSDRISDEVSETNVAENIARLAEWVITTIEMIRYVSNG